MGINYEPASVATKKKQKLNDLQKKCSEERWALSELSVIRDGGDFCTVNNTVM